jgi:tetratricopeptide (TPR) repeat protein
MLVNRRHLHIVEDHLRKRLFQIVAVLLVIGLVLGTVLFFDRVDDFLKGIYHEFYSLIDFDSTYVNVVRLIFFQMAGDSALQRPWFGRGIGSFNWHMPETRYHGYHRSGVSHNTDHPHNEHLEWLHDTGLFGLAMFWWILAAYFWTGVREIHRQRKGYYFPLVLMSFGGPWMQWIQATFDVETRWTGNNVTLWTTIGFALAFRNLPVILKREELDAVRVQTPEPRAMPSRRRGATRIAPVETPLQTSPYLPYVAAIFTLLTLFYLVKARDHWMADHHLRNNMMHTEGGPGGNIQQAIKESERAQALAYTITSNYYKLAYSYLVANRPDSALESYRDLQSFAPNYAQIHINLAYLNDQLGYRIAALGERDRAALIEHNIRNHRDAAQHWLQFGSPRRAIAHLRQSLTIMRDRVPQYIIWHEFDSIYADLARIHLSLGETAVAFHALEKALRLNASNKSAGLLLAELQADPARKPEVERLVRLVMERSPNNPALLIFAMDQAIKEGRLPEALALATTATSLLSMPPPGGQPDQELVGFGNAVLQSIQRIFAANHDQARCFALAGWIYACQARYQEADNFLTRAYAELRDPKVAEQLGAVKARLGN